MDSFNREGLHTVYLTDDAYQEWLEFAHAIEKRMKPDGDLKEFTDWGGKAPGSAVRIAGVLHGIKHAHANPWDAKITHETMSSALDIMAIITQHSMAALELMGIDKDIDDAEYLWDWICRQRVTGYKQRDAFNALRSRFQKVGKMQPAWGILEERGYIKILEPPPPDGPGRPSSPVIYVRDDFRKDW